MTLDTKAVLVEQISSNIGARSLLDQSLDWMSALFDETESLLWSPQYRGKRHNVRESIWYALGLFGQSYLTEDESELDRAVKLIEAVLDNQWDAPGKIWHGTFKRAPEESDPPNEAKIWIDYDPNWRQFIGTILLLLLRLEGNGRLSELSGDIRRALTLCIQGEPETRVPPSYTNIALMRAWLEVQTASDLDVDYRERGLNYARRIYEGFRQNGAFAEYNSPTYYGVNFYALGLWQHYSNEPELRRMGQEITEALWRDVGRFYHHGLRNICGPWSRSYGMDMQRYVGGVGLWMWAIAGQEHAPFPNEALAKGAPLGHDHDFGLGPLAALTATPPPEDTKDELSGFSAPRRFQQVISTSPKRTAHVAIEQNWMVGLETADISYRGTDQYHPLTGHWQSGEQTHWFRLRFKGRLEGEIKGEEIELILIPDEGVTNCTLEFDRPGQHTGHRYDLDGLSLIFETDHPLQFDEHVQISDLTHQSTLTIRIQPGS